MNIEKKIVSVAAAAVMCAAVAAVPVSAEENDVSAAQVSVSETAASNSILSSYMKEFGISYSKGAAKKAKSISSNKARASISFNDSRTAKMFGNIQRSSDPNNEFVFGVRSSDELMVLSVKGDDTRMVLCDDEYCFDMFVIDNTKIYLCDPSTKEAIMMEDSEGMFGLGEDSTTYLDPADLNIDPAAEVSVYKFTYKNKRYIYECFTDEAENKVGFLYNSKGDLIMINSDGEFFGCLLSTSAKSSWFEIPSDYTIMTDDEFMADYDEYALAE